MIEAAKLKLPFRLLMRTALNILLELVVGAVPIFGDMFDFSFRGNLRKVWLLNTYLQR